MKYSNKTRRQNGVGLIEILIVLVVLVIGWAAIAALQGTLMSGTSATKARNEALELAREKTEEMRNTIEKGLYLADLVSASDTVYGINATFNRAWTFSDVDIDSDGTTENYVKKLAITVTWANNEAATENVVLNSIITFPNKLAIASYATSGTGDGTGSPGTPNAESGSEGPGTITGNPSLDADGDGNPNTTDDNIYTGVDDNGNLVVYQGLASNGKFDNGLTVYGGKIIKFSGKIYYDSSEPYVRATSPSLCATFIKTKQQCGLGTKIDCADYVCYAGGDCKDGGDGCPTDQTVLDALPNLNGGWWGKIGDFFPYLANANKFPEICMGDSIGAPARLFYSKRTNPGSTTGYEREGINTSFECQKIAITTGTCAAMFSDLKTLGIQIDPTLYQIPFTQVIRTLGATEDNMVLAATNNSYNNSVFANFCGGSSSSSSSSSSGSSSGSSSSSSSSSSSGSSSGSSSSSSSSSSSGSSSGGTSTTYQCACLYTSGQVGMSVVGTPNLGCCTLAQCDTLMPNPKNKDTANYSCTIP